MILEASKQDLKAGILGPDPLLAGNASRFFGALRRLLFIGLIVLLSCSCRATQLWEQLVQSEGQVLLRKLCPKGIKAAVGLRAGARPARHYCRGNQNGKAAHELVQLVSLPRARTRERRRRGKEKKNRGRG